jgi:hypothetical protein
MTRTKEPPIPLNTLDPAPLKKALVPSWAAIFLKQSIVPLYKISFFPSFPFLPDYIIILLLTVSRGYETNPATAVTFYINKFTMANKNFIRKGAVFSSLKNMTLPVS